jgi:hypothetical protein
LLSQVLVASLFLQVFALTLPVSRGLAGELHGVVLGNSSNSRIEKVDSTFTSPRGEQERADATSTNEIERRGAELRAALEANYKKLVELKQLHGGGDTDATDVVIQYIPVGTKFSEAQDVLQAAGFRIEPHPNLNETTNPNRSRDWYAVLANVSPFASKFPFRVDLTVALLPKAPRDYTDVAEVTATFFVSGP